MMFDMLGGIVVHAVTPMSAVAIDLPRVICERSLQVLFIRPRDHP